MLWRGLQASPPTGGPTRRRSRSTRDRRSDPVPGTLWMKPIYYFWRAIMFTIKEATLEPAFETGLWRGCGLRHAAAMKCWNVPLSSRLASRASARAEVYRHLRRWALAGALACEFRLYRDRACIMPQTGRRSAASAACSPVRLYPAGAASGSSFGGARSTASSAAPVSIRRAIPAKALVVLDPIRAMNCSVLDEKARHQFARGAYRRTVACSPRRDQLDHEGDRLLFQRPRRSEPAAIETICDGIPPPAERLLPVLLPRRPSGVHHITARAGRRNAELRACCADRASKRSSAAGPTGCATPLPSALIRRVARLVGADIAGRLPDRSSRAYEPMMAVGLPASLKFTSEHPFRAPTLPPGWWSSRAGAGAFHSQSRLIPPGARAGAENMGFRRRRTQFGHIRAWQDALEVCFTDIFEQRPPADRFFHARGAVGGLPLS